MVISVYVPKASDQNSMSPHDKTFRQTSNRREHPQLDKRHLQNPQLMLYLMVKDGCFLPEILGAEGRGRVGSKEAKRESPWSHGSTCPSDHLLGHGLVVDTSLCICQSCKYYTPQKVNSTVYKLKHNSTETKIINW